MDAVGFRLSFTPLTGVLFTVPSRYCALSVTTSILPWTVVGPASHQITRVWWYSRSSSSVVNVGGTGLSPAAVCRSRQFPTLTFPRCSGCTLNDKSHNPNGATRARLTRRWFRQPPGSLATTSGGILLPQATEMFQFAHLPSLTGYPCKPRVGCPIRRRWARCVVAAPPSYRR